MLRAFSANARSVVGGLVFALLISTAHAQPVPSLDGAWLVKSAEFQMAPYRELVGATLTIKDGKFRFERPEHSPWAGTVHVDSGAKTIEFVHEIQGVLPPLKGDKWEGIFRLEGSRLIINTSEGRDARPTEFLSGYDLVLMTLERK